MNFNLYSHLLILVISLQLFYRQIFKFKIEDKNRSLEIFKSNNFLGFLVLLNLIIGKVYQWKIVFIS